MLSSNSFPYKELGTKEGSSPLCRAGKKHHTGKRTLLVDWDSLADITKYILGFPTAIVNGSTCTLTREMPETHPTFPWMIATEVDVVKGVTWTGEKGDYLNKYQSAEIEVTYEDVDYNCFEDEAISSELDRYVSYREERSADYLTIPQGSSFWASNAPSGFSGVAIPHSIGRVVAYKELHYTWHEIPYHHAPFATIDDRVGTVNKTTFDGYPAGTLLCMPPRTEIIRLADGSFGWEIEYIFRYAAWKHNYLFLNNTSGGASGYYQMNRTAGSLQVEGSITDGQCIYNEREFSTLFTLEVNPHVPE